MIGCKINSDDFNPIRRLDGVRNFRGPCVIPRPYQPTVVRFANEADPMTVEWVKPPERGGVDGDLEIVGVTVERTDRPVEYPILSRLPWLIHYRQPDLRVTPMGIVMLTRPNAYAYGYLGQR